MGARQGKQSPRHTTHVEAIPSPRLPPTPELSRNLPKYDEVKQIFRGFDKNGDGKISIEELKLAIKFEGPVSLLKSIVEEKNFDKNHDNELDFTEFYGIIEHLVLQNFTKMSGGGEYITKETYAKFRSEQGLDSDAEMVAEILNGMDANNDGQISLQEYVDARLGKFIGNAIYS